MDTNEPKKDEKVDNKNTKENDEAEEKKGENLSEEDKKRLEYHMKSTNSVAFLESDSETPDVEMQEDDFDW